MHRLAIIADNKHKITNKYGIKLQRQIIKIKTNPHMQKNKLDTNIKITTLDQNKNRIDIIKSC